jgi:hypothetical protein
MVKKLNGLNAERPEYGKPGRQKLNHGRTPTETDGHGPTRTDTDGEGMNGLVDGWKEPENRPVRGRKGGQICNVCIFVFMNVCAVRSENY